ncbi:DUF2147 domain-containing protein [Novosphingobium sp. Gsoil 351]|uniref:DUF2147 domain-containing protein n=1 Tax=Novosphingobium sp. Gsoil 351 TaxID=2675225 RepID=UPI0018A87FA7|nr:DUF2147 domain-containing protein [Novosphingobium sp. Gsoil 351]
MPRIVLTVAAFAATTANAAPASIAGNWNTDDGRAIVTVAPCGGGLCATISRFLFAEPPGGVRDAKNPDPKLRNRRVLGSNVLWNLKPAGKTWAGTGYSARDGRTFKATASSDGGRLNLKGCVMVFCKTVVWTRVQPLT